MGSRIRPGWRGLSEIDCERGEGEAADSSKGDRPSRDFGFRADNDPSAQRGTWLTCIRLHVIAEV